MDAHVRPTLEVVVVAGATALFVHVMSGHVIVSLALSPFFGRAMVAGVLLLAAPAILGFYVSGAGRSFIGTALQLE